MLWRGQQIAIGEVMTINDGGEPMCIGYAAFHQKWRGKACEAGKVTPESNSSEAPQVEDNKNGGEDQGIIWDGEFRPWFRPIIDGVTEVAKAANERPTNVPDQRLRRLQHLLLDLINILDAKGLRSEAKYTRPCHRAVICNCSKCKDKTSCPCNRCNAPRESGQV